MAGGVVVYADFHPRYGNIAEIDDGNDVGPRYVHASKLLVKNPTQFLRLPG